MVNSELLQKHVQQLKMGKPAAIDYYKELFSKHSDVAEAYGGIEPDAVGRSQRYVMLAINELQAFVQMPTNLADDRSWRSALSNFKEHYSDADVPLKYFGKTKDAFLTVLQKHAGGLNAEQKKNWEELMEKANADMKKWGWL
uniref:Globin family profile domain-containing protein n=2 Tax=Globodera TaxID=31242 RepID=A0A914I8D1_GLORO